ncbi:MAG: tetratricopeptide repeat domain protein [Fibrobacteres bacterium]|nr:tetratricopeptide repeat domain protein [Fibrobacterota bacterium]
MSLRQSLIVLPGLLFLSACTSVIRSGGSGTYGTADLPEPAFDRTACGTAPIGLWSALTAPELRALQDREKAASGDPDALLALAIFASGDKRAPEEYAAIHARIAAFTEKMKPELAAEKNPWQKGFKLHKAMHAAFFPPSRAEETRPSGYAWEQSRFTGIFADGKYNCVSSAILYLVLAREFGFDAQGVLLPSHAFVQLRLPDGKIIEVETTTPSGFDWIHDEAFYKKRAGPWFAARGLPASTFKDYQARRIMRPLDLIALNMSNQHTAPKLMKPQDRYRLIEARSYLDPADRDGGINRVAFYAAEFAYLSKRGEWAALQRMYASVTASLAMLHRQWGEDTEFANHLAWQPYYYATTLRGLGRGAEAFPWIDTSLAWLRPAAKEGPVLKSNNEGLIILITRESAEKKDFAAAERDLLRYPGLLRENQNLGTHLAWVYQEWAMQDWERKDWESAAAKLGKALEYAGKEYRKPIRDNMATAYLNRAAVRQNEGDWPKAREALRHCLEKVPEAKKCKTWMDELVAQHNLDD